MSSCKFSWKPLLGQQVQILQQPLHFLILNVNRNIHGLSKTILTHVPLMYQCIILCLLWWHSLDNYHPVHIRNHLINILNTLPQSKTNIINTSTRPSCDGNSCALKGITEVLKIVIPARESSVVIIYNP